MREEKKLSASSINVAYCALKFFYTQILHREFGVEKISRPKREKKAANNIVKIRGPVNIRRGEEFKIQDDINDNIFIRLPVDGSIAS